MVSDTIVTVVAAVLAPVASVIIINTIVFLLYVIFGRYKLNFHICILLLTMGGMFAFAYSRCGETISEHFQYTLDSDKLILKRGD